MSLVGEYVLEILPSLPLDDITGEGDVLKATQLSSINSVMLRAQRGQFNLYFRVNTFSCIFHYNDCIKNSIVKF